MKKIIKQSEMIPNLYGIAYWDYQKNIGVCYPLGINLVVMLWKEFVKWNKFPKQGK